MSDRITPLIGGLQLAIETFREYAQIHASKPDGTGIEKAKRNLDLAKQLEYLISQDDAARRQEQAVRKVLTDEAIEAAYWSFDARKKGLGQWRGVGQLSERDAFKLTVQGLVNDLTKSS